MSNLVIGIKVAASYRIFPVVRGCFYARKRGVPGGQQNFSSMEGLKRMKTFYHFLKRCKKWFLGLYAAYRTDMRKAVNYGLRASTALYTTLACGVFALAAIDTSEVTALAQDIQTLGGTIYKWLVILSTIFAGCFAIAALIMRMFASQQTAQRATQWLVRVLVSYGIMVGLGVIFSIIGSLFGATSTLEGAISTSP